MLKVIIADDEYLVCQFLKKNYRLEENEAGVRRRSFQWN